MPELSWIQWVGVVGVLGVVAGWLATSLQAPGRGRSRAAWAATLGLYVALLALFTGLLLRAHQAGSLPGRIAFGFLAAFFAAGLVLTVVRLVRAIAGREGAGGEHAAH